MIFKRAAVGRVAMWLSPWAGAFGVALYLSIRAGLAQEPYPLFVFGVWFVERAVVGYFLAMPMLVVAKRFGRTHVFGFMLLASLAAWPLEYYTSEPLNAWHPTEAELEHGFYLETFIPCVLLASLTGALFAWGLRQDRQVVSDQQISSRP